MQLDETRIAVRERGYLDTLDVSLQVFRAYFSPIMQTALLGIVPLMLLNHYLLSWMADVHFSRDIAEVDLSGMFRFSWNMALLVFVQAPLGTMFTTSFIGKAVFLDQPSFREVVEDVWKMAPKLIWCQLLLRGIAPAIALMFLVERYGEYDGVLEGFFLIILALYVAILRAVRPFMNEIVLLERNPLRKKAGSIMTISRRSALLHGPAGGDLFVQALGCVCLAILLTLSLYGTFIFIQGVWLNDWRQGPILLKFCLPFSMWLVATFMAVFRFMSYLGLRIRQEGWEVELNLRAEAARLTKRVGGETA